MQAAAKTIDEPQEVVQAYKGFDKDLICAGGDSPFQYALGETYTSGKKVVRCGSGGFHSCEYPLDCFSYYAPGISRFARVTASGKIAREKDGDTKIASGTITIGTEITIPQMITDAIAWIIAKCEPDKAEHATGYRSASSATGYSSASSATGYRSASSATGDISASSATGYRSASLSTGRFSSSEITPADEPLHAVAIAVGGDSKARAPEGSAIVVAYRNEYSELIHIRASRVGDNGIKPNVWYSLSEAGEFVEA